VFIARYAPSSYINQTRLFFKDLTSINIAHLSKYELPYFPSHKTLQVNITNPIISKTRYIRFYNLALRC